jgi:ActR/RegA family two-component response regulator
MAPVENILIVEDDRVWSEIYERAIARLGTYAVRTATTLEDAEMLVAAMAFAVAFVDVGLDEHDDRNVDGLRVMQELADSEDRTSLIVVTGMGTLQIARDAMKKYNAVDVLDKPQVDPADLPKLLDEALQAYKKASASRPARVQDVFRGKLEPWLWDDRIQRAIHIDGGIQSLYHFLEDLFLSLLPLVPRFKGQQVEIDPSTSIAHGEYWSRAIGAPLLVCFGTEDRVAATLAEQPSGNGFLAGRNVGKIIRDRSFANLRGLVFQLPGQLRSSFFG